MGSRGPAPTPTKLLEARGSWRAKINPDEPKPLKGRPKMPSRLSAAAKKIWRALVVQIDAMGLLSQTDSYQLERYCTYFVRWRECEDWIAKNGITYTLRADEAARYIGRLPDSGAFIAGFAEYPQVKESHRLDKALKQIEAQFGLTPAARARLHSPDMATDTGDPMEKLLRVHTN